MNAFVSIALALMLNNATPSDLGVKEKVDAYLSSIDTPIATAAWKALGPDADQVLRAVISDKNNLPTRRAKAIDGLAAVGGASAINVLREAARSESEPLVVRLTSLRGLERVADHPTLDVEMASILSGAHDLRVRAVAGEILVNHAGRAACAAILAQVAVEASSDRGHFERALASCRR